MTSTRPYRAALSHEAALAELRLVSGTQLNPVVVDAFIRQLDTPGPGVAHAHDGLEHVHVRERAAEAVRLTTN